MKLKTKVLVTQPIHEKGMKMLEESVEKVVLAPSDDVDVIATLLDDEVEGVIVRYNVFNRELIEKAKNLKVIARHGIGLDLIDLEAATEHGVMVVNTPSAATVSVAEHVVMIILMLSKNVIVGHRELCKGNYKIKDQYSPDDVEGKVVGFIGLGRIGSEAAKRCIGLGMKVIGYDPFPNSELLKGLDITLVENMETVLKEADFITLHTPLSEETTHMIDKEQLAMIKKTSFLINTSRGAVVNEAALIEALENGVIAGAGLDVFEAEPPAVDNPLFQMDNVVVTPHSSSLTLNSKIKMATGAVEQLLKVLKNEKPDYLVNREVLSK